MMFLSGFECKSLARCPCDVRINFKTTIKETRSSLDRYDRHASCCTVSPRLQVAFSDPGSNKQRHVGYGQVMDIK